MLNGDAADSVQAVSQTDIYNELEPLDCTSSEYREASRRLLGFLGKIMTYMLSASNKDELVLKAWAVAAAIEHPLVGGRSDLRLAEDLGTSRQNLCKHMLSLERQVCLPPKFTQKTVAARAAYRQARMEQLS